MIALSSMPCNDIDQCINTDVKELITSQHQNHQHKDDSCNPFCTCSCCSITVSIQENQKETVTHIVYKSTQIPPSNNKLISEDFSSIWQPPKLV